MSETGGFRAGADSWKIAELETWAAKAKAATGDTRTTEARCRDSDKGKGRSICKVDSSEAVHGCIDGVGGVVAGAIDELERRESGECEVYVYE